MGLLWGKVQGAVEKHTLTGICAINSLKTEAYINGNTTTSSGEDDDEDDTSENVCQVS